MTCIVRMNCTKSPSSALAHSFTHNNAISDHVRTLFRHTEDNKNRTDLSMEGSSKDWLSKVCSKLRSGGKPRAQKCEKCGQRSNTCLPNPSFVSGRKHFLCGDCRVSSRNMKSMYQQLCRNLSLRETSRPAAATATTTTCGGSSDLSSLSLSPSSSPSPLIRSKPLNLRPISPVESGYETATSLDLDSSSDYLSTDNPALSTSSGKCGRCNNLLSGGVSPASYPATGDREGGQIPCAEGSGKHACRSRTEVFGGAFRSERVHLQSLQRLKVEEWVHSQSPVECSKDATTLTATARTKQYDGYLESRTPNSPSVKYVFTKSELGEHCLLQVTQGVQQQRQQLQKQQQQQQQGGEGLKQCYRCQKKCAVVFSAPFRQGWLCEDCMDDLM